ncbi:hypothetical protein Trydic_g2017 [Trypoxylus dichotomus]
MSDTDSSLTEKRKISHFEENETKKRKKELLKPPTTEEINQLRETEHLYSSNLIRLQIEELFLPDKNNIKYDCDDSFKDVVAKDFGEIGTPKHNSFIARDCTLHMNYEFMQSLLNVKNIQDGIKLLMLWLTQRQMNKGIGNFTTELTFYTVAYLVKRKKINCHMSSYQVLRIFWSFLKDTKWNEEPISLSDDVKIDTINMFKENYDIVFLDVSGTFNITSCLHLGIYLRLKQEAELALQILDGTSFSGFTSLFLMKIPFTLQYDALVIFNVENTFDVIYKNIRREDKWKYYGFYRDLIISEINNILTQGLTNRVSSVVPYTYSDEVGDSSIKPNITFGINLNPESAFNVIERGPSEDNPDAVRKFQEFWKGLTSFRRFQDSSVAEVVHFQCRTLQDKRNIFLKILEFLFKKKYPLQMKIVSNQLEKVFKLESTIIHFPTGTNEEACLKIKHIYNDLNKILRNLQLPLIVTNIQGTSDSFSYTELFPPIPTTYKEDENMLSHNESKLIIKPDARQLPRHVAPIQCIVQMGKSSGWPDDVSVLQCMKCEFYIKLSELLESEYNIMSSVTLDQLDIFYEGLVFRIKLFVPKELMLLKRTINNEGIVSYKDNEESLQLERDMDILPKVTSALSGIHQIYPSFGPSCALIKRWLRSQLIDNYHISDTVINLWNASLYLNDPPYKIAQLPQVAFLRFLQYLIHFDWKLNPVIVNFNEDISNIELSEIEAQFQQNRNGYPNLYIIIPYDQRKSIFTKFHPSKHILKRIRLLANETYRFLTDAILKWDNFPVKDIFVPNLQGYDVLIYLRDSMNPVSYQNLFLNCQSDKQYIERYDKEVSNKIPVIDFNPVEKYIKELREIYGEYAIFFYDPYGGNVIGILWNKQVLDPREFKVLHVNAKKVVDGKLIINYDAILEDIYNRGHGIIKSLEKM